ncbi:DUF2182 domain-containing protein [Litorimonas sp. WD9-15]|uniref:copper chaperone n=1 Tax=Litorimonas sp. WD9-15 TaxID=3418716 RepID=UPI003D019A4D
MFRTKRGYFPLLTGISAVLFSLIALAPSQMTMVGLCGKVDPALLWQILRLQVAVLSPVSVFIAWALMVGAMMLPLIAREMDHVRQLVRRSAVPLALTGFVLGYLSIWVLSGIYSLPLALGLTLGFPSESGARYAALGLSILLALVWSGSPLAQLARNRCHKPALIGFGGLRPLWGSAKFGLRIGVYCHLTCWPWMIVPFLVPDFHVTAMVIVTVVIFADRMSIPRVPAWQWPPVFEAFASAWPFRSTPQLGR